jgi:hypothetical protein
MPEVARSTEISLLAQTAPKLYKDIDTVYPYGSYIHQKALEADCD